MTRNLNNAFANLLTPNLAMRAIGTRIVIQVQFDDRDGNSLRAAIPNMPDKCVVDYVVIKHRVGRSQVGPWRRAEVIAR